MRMRTKRGQVQLEGSWREEHESKMDAVGNPVAELGTRPVRFSANAIKAVRPSVRPSVILSSSGPPLFDHNFIGPC